MKRYHFLGLGLALAASIACNENANIEDRALFGFTSDFVNSLATAPAASCTSDVTVQQQSVSLIENGVLGGDQTRAWQPTTPFYSETDTNGGSSYGVFREEVCIYLVESFNGTVEIPVSASAAYADFLTITQTFPLADAGNPLPSALSFTGDGTTGHGDSGRICFNIEAISDVNTVGETLSLDLASITTGDDDGFYTGKDPCNIDIAIEDDDGPGVRVSNISRVMEEPGGTGATDATFRVRLRTMPAADVTMGINDTADPVNAANREGSADLSSLTFTPANFATEQLVTVRSVDDLEVDGLKAYTIAVTATSSADSDYNGLEPRDVVVFNNDQSVPGYVYELFDTTTGNTTSSSAGNITGFATDQQNNMGQTYSTFQLNLRSRPSANVTLNFSNSNTAVANLLTPSLTFTPTNWNIPQTVRVEGRPDGLDDGNEDFTISFTTTTTDTTYGGGSAVPRPSFVMRSCDNDNSNLIQPCNFSGSRFGTTGSRFAAAEGGASEVWLISKNNPGGTATVGLTSTDLTEGTVAASVTVDASNFNRLDAAGTNRIAMTHVNELDLDGNQNWTVTTATSTGAISFDPLDIFARTNDNESLYYISTSGSTQEGTATAASIHICLGSNNPSPVQISATCNDGGSDECGTITADPATGSGTFEAGTPITAAVPSNAACATDPNRVTFTVTGFDDSFADGTQNFGVTLTLGNAPAAPYGGTNPPDSGNINNADNETPGKAIFVTSGTFNGEMTAAGVQGGDTICQSNRPGYVPSGTYKAMLVSNSGGVSGINARVATTDGTTAAGQTDWVLSANNFYYRCDGNGYTNCSDEHKRLFRANSVGLIPFPLTTTTGNRFFSSNSGHVVWTGMNANQTPATQASTPGKVVGTDPDYRDNCAGFTFVNGPSSPNPGYFGQSWSVAAGGSITSNTNVACSTTLRIICVQQ